MIEVGGEYKLKKLNLPYIHNDEDTFEILYEISPQVVACLNTNTRENVVLQKKFFIDPEHPEDDTFEGVTIEPTTIVTEDMGGCVAASAGGLGGGMASLGAAPCPTMAQASNGVSGAMVNGMPVEGKSVKKKKKKSKKNENIFTDMEDAKKQYVQDTKDAEEYLKELKTLSKKELIDLLPHPFGQDDIDYYNTKDEKDLITKILKNKFNLAGEYVGKHFNEEYEEESGYYMDTVEGTLSYVTPDEMLEKIEDTFEPTDGFYTVVENPRERIRVTVKYTNPDDKVLTHALQLEFLDEVDNILDTLYEENLSQVEVLDRLQEIFSMHQEANLIIEEYIQNLLEDFNEEYEEITEQIAKYLDRLNFQFANTTDIVYKKEGEYKYLFKFDNEIGIIKIKILKGDEVLVEKEYEIDETQDIQPIFDEIESIYNKYGL